MGNLKVTIPDLKVKLFGHPEATGEIYLLTLGLDLSMEGSTNINDISDNEDNLSPIDDLIPDQLTSLNKYAVISVTPVFHGIRRGCRLPIYGDGIILYGPKDPKGKIMLHTAVMEYDGGARNFVKLLDQALKQTKLFDTIDDLMKLASLTAPQLKAITSTARFLFETVIYLLKNNKDDVITTFHYSSTYSKTGQGDKRAYITDENPGFTLNDRFIEGHFKVSWEED